MSRLINQTQLYYTEVRYSIQPDLSFTFSNHNTKTIGVGAKTVIFLDDNTKQILQTTFDIDFVLKKKEKRKSQNTLFKNNIRT